MSPSKRCDEILRLIDEVLQDDAATPVDAALPMLELPSATIDWLRVNASE